jgi:hypothetical protein
MSAPYEGRSWGAGEGAIAIAALMMMDSPDENP